MLFDAYAGKMSRVKHYANVRSFQIYAFVIYRSASATFDALRVASIMRARTVPRHFTTGGNSPVFTRRPPRCVAVCCR